MAHQKENHKEGQRDPSIKTFGEANSLFIPQALYGFLWTRPLLAALAWSPPLYPLLCPRFTFPKTWLYCPSCLDAFQEPPQLRNGVHCLRKNGPCLQDLAVGPSPVS